jgi:RNA polymerase sigma factor (sigma-70 family)
MDQGEDDLPARLATDLDPSFERLMLAYWHQLYAFVLRRVESQQDAEDIVSEAFVRAYLALKGYPAERVRTLKLRPWLYKIAYHEYCRFIGRSRLPSVPFALEEMGMGVEQEEDQRKQPELFFERAERRQELETLVAALPDRFREAVDIVLRQRYPDGVVTVSQVEEQNQSSGVGPGDTQQRPVVARRGLSRRVVAVALAVALVVAGAGTLWSLLLQSPESGAPAHSTPAVTRSPRLTFYGPGYTVLDSRGNLYVMDSDFQQTHTRILKFSPSGHLLKQWDHLDIDAQPLYIVVDGQGNIYATAQATNSIYRLSATGEPLQKWQVAGQDPVGLALDQQGNLYVAVYSGNTIQKYSSTGKLLEMWGASGSGPGQFNHPVGVAVDSQGDLFVVDQGNNRIQKLTPSGKFIAQWGTTGAGPGQFLQPGSIAVDSKSNVFVTDGSSGLVQEFSSSGKLLAAWGAGGPRALQFGIPRGVAVDGESNIYVASVDLNGETFVNGRITKFSPSGELLAVWK